MTDFTPSPAPSGQGGTASTSPVPAPSDLANLRIAEFGADGKPLRVEPLTPDGGQVAPQPSPLATPDPAPEPPPTKPNLHDIPEFREWQSKQDRRLAQQEHALAQRDQQLQASQRELEALRKQVREAEIKERMAQAATPLEQEQVRTQLEREDFERDRETFERDRTNREDLQTLADNERIYVTQWGVPPQTMQEINRRTAAQVQQMQQQQLIERGDELVQFHAIRDAMTRQYAEQLYYARQQQAAASTQPQPVAPPPSPPVPPQPVPAQVVARPATTMPIASSPEALRLRAMSTGRHEDWVAWRNSQKQAY